MAILTIALNIQSVLHVTWTIISYISLGCIIIIALGCFLNGRRKSCRNP